MDCLHVLAMIYYTPPREQEYISQLSTNIFMRSSVLNEAITFFSVTNAPLKGIYYSGFIQVKHSQMLLVQRQTSLFGSGYCTESHKYTMRFTLRFSFSFLKSQISPTVPNMPRTEKRKRRCATT